MIRKVAVADGFYPKSPGLLLEELNRCFSKGFGNLPEFGNEKKPIGGIVPHAGYTYSGSVASYTYATIRAYKKPETVVIVGPNHTGYGSDVSVWYEGEWETPLGLLKIDEEVSRILLKDFPEFTYEAHEFEHSIEVQLPFIYYTFGPEVKIVPVCVLDQSLKKMIKLGESLSAAVNGKNVALLASSDFTHYEPQKVAMSNDLQVIQAILRLDEKEVIKVADELGVNACGLGPIISVINCLKKLGKVEAKMLKYSTSGDATGNYDSVVGYASVVFFVR